MDITVYLDESEMTGQKHVVLGGFYGNDDQWNGFADEWRAALGGRKALHMKELRWNGSAAERRLPPLLSRLGAIPSRRKLTPVYGAVKVSHYADLIEREPKYKDKVILNGYVSCLALILSILSECIPGHARIRIICERQDYFKETAEQFFYVFKNQIGKFPQYPFFSDIQFVEKNSTTLTQPSDFLSFAIAKWLDEPRSKKDLWCRPILGDRKPYQVQGRRFRRQEVRERTARVIQASHKHESIFNTADFREWSRRYPLRQTSPVSSARPTI